MSFKVQKKQCDQCLFSKNRIVDSKRMKQILKDCDKRDVHFICHKGTMNGKDVCCRGFYDTRTTNLIRIAGRLGVIEEVELK